MFVHMLNDVENIVDDLALSHDIGYGTYTMVADGTSLTISYMYDAGANAQRR